jgi:hypothetical protein
MPSQSEAVRFTVEQFAERFRHEMVPLGNRFSYFFIALPLNEEDIKEYLEEPVAALPPAIAGCLPKLSICLVPFLERTNGKDNARFVSLESPPEQRQTLSARLTNQDEVCLLFAVEGREVADYHYRLYHEFAELSADALPEDIVNKYFGELREELAARVHGEVDEDSWRLKQALQRQSGKLRRETKAFRQYARQSLIDTLTLYLHGICCDIDVDTGPRQLPSRYLRKRLELLKELFPPPQSYAVFPEDLPE